MEHPRLARLLSYRRHLERLARAQLEEAVSDLARVRDEEASLLASRREHESACAGSWAVDSEELRQRYAHLARLERDLSEVRSRIEDHEQRMAARRDELVEARQEVQKLEALQARAEAERRKRESRQSQRILDAHALRRHRPGATT